MKLYFVIRMSRPTEPGFGPFFNPVAAVRFASQFPDSRVMSVDSQQVMTTPV